MSDDLEGDRGDEWTVPLLSAGVVSTSVRPRRRKAGRRGARPGYQIWSLVLLVAPV